MKNKETLSDLINKLLPRQSDAKRTRLIDTVCSNSKLLSIAVSLRTVRILTDEKREEKESNLTPDLRSGAPKTRTHLDAIFVDENTTL